QASRRRRPCPSPVRRRWRTPSRRTAEDEREARAGDLPQHLAEVRGPLEDLAVRLGPRDLGQAARAHRDPALVDDDVRRRLAAVLAATAAGALAGRAVDGGLADLRRHQGGKTLLVGLEDFGG